MNGTQKAWFGGIMAALVAGIGVAVTASEDGAFTTTEWLQIVLAALVAFGATGGTVYKTTTKVDGVPQPVLYPGINTFTDRQE